MKIACFHLMPYRDLDDDFEKKYPSSWFSLPFSEVADRQKVSQYFNWTLDELRKASVSNPAIFRPYFLVVLQAVLANFRE